MKERPTVRVIIHMRIFYHIIILRTRIIYICISYDMILDFSIFLCFYYNLNLYVIIHLIYFLHMCTQIYEIDVHHIHYTLFSLLVSIYLKLLFFFLYKIYYSIYYYQLWYHILSKKEKNIYIHI